MTTLVMPVAGMGSRFTAAGYATPKPMIPLDGRTFVEWAWESARRAMDVRRTVFVARPEHLLAGMDLVLERAAPGSTVVVSSGPVEGAASDAALALPYLTPDEPVAINDCDHAFLVDSALDQSFPEGGAVAVLGFPSTNPAHGYGLLSGHGRGDLLGIAEKRISGPMAVGGCYLFSSPAVLAGLVEAARPVAGEGEFYASRLVNAAVRQGMKATMHAARRYVPFGTPEELGRLRHGQIARMLSS